MRKYLLLLLISGAVAIALVMSYVLYEGPRMKVQSHLRTYQYMMPLPVKGTVPVEPPPMQLSPPPVPPGVPDATITARGKIYYTYYYAFCHGTEGKGDGPVGLSYAPTPSNIQSDRVRRASDSDLLRLILTGVGHEPVLDQVVQPEHRLPLIRYVRQLSIKP